MMIWRRLPYSLLLLGLLSGCSWFDSKDEEVIKPAALKKIQSEVTLSALWTARVGAGAADKAIKLEPALSGGRIFAASADGGILAVQADTGNKVWSRDVRDLYAEADVDHAFAKDVDVITGGVGAGNDIILVGTSAGEVLALY